MAADKFTRHRLEQKAKEMPPDLHVEHSAYIAYLEEMSDEQLEQYLAEFVARTQGDYPSDMTVVRVKE